MVEKNIDEYASSGQQEYTRDNNSKKKFFNREKKEKEKKKKKKKKKDPYILHNIDNVDKKQRKMEAETSLGERERDKILRGIWIGLDWIGVLMMAMAMMDVVWWWTRRKG